MGKQPKLMIIGSMPSQRSLQQAQYYAHPRNAFWWLLSELLGFDLALSYPQRVNAVTQAGIAVWDVLKDCQRAGSLDSNIVRSSEQANDFAPMLAANPSLKLLAFNGAKAKQIFMRHQKHCLAEFNLKWVQLPSSSPAHAATTRADKLRDWQSALIPFIDND